MSESGGKKHDQNKPRMELISPVVNAHLARILTKGATNHGDHNWRQGFKWSRIIGALKRHLNEFESGNDFDYDEDCPECHEGRCKKHTGEPHIALVMTNCMFLLEFMYTHKELDDRWKIVDHVKPNKQESE